MDEPMPTPQPWEMQPGETARSFQAFSVYREMGPQRSLVKAGQTLGKSPATLEEWSVRHAWVSRVLSFDEAQSRRTALDQEATRKKAVARHGQLAGGVLAQAARHLTPPRFQADGVTELTETERRTWKARPDVVRMATHALKEASVVERLALGLPTVISKTQVETEQAVEEALEAQRILEAVVREGLDGECSCEPCRILRDRLQQLRQHQERARTLLTTSL